MASRACARPGCGARGDASQASPPVEPLPAVFQFQVNRPWRGAASLGRQRSQTKVEGAGRWSLGWLVSGVVPSMDAEVGAVSSPMGAALVAVASSTSGWPWRCSCSPPTRGPARPIPSSSARARRRCGWCSGSGWRCWCWSGGPIPYLLALGTCAWALMGALGPDGRRLHDLGAAPASPPDSRGARGRARAGRVRPDAGRLGGGRPVRRRGGAAGGRGAGPARPVGRDPPGLVANLRDQAERLEREQLLDTERAKAQERARIAGRCTTWSPTGSGLMVLHAGALEVSLADPAAAQQAALVRQTGREALQELRDVLGVLREGGQRPARSTRSRPWPTWTGWSSSRGTPAWRCRWRSTARAGGCRRRSSGPPTGWCRRR